MFLKRCRFVCNLLLLFMIDFSCTQRKAWRLRDVLSSGRFFFSFFLIILTTQIIERKGSCDSLYYLSVGEGRLFVRSVRIQDNMAYLFILFLQLLCSVKVRSTLLSIQCVSNVTSAYTKRTGAHANYDQLFDPRCLLPLYINEIAAM